jgi:hypothetical protein
VAFPYETHCEQGSHPPTADDDDVHAPIEHARSA